MICLVELRGLEPLTLCLQNRGHTESTFENFALSSGRLSARVRRRPPISAQCCGTLLLYRPGVADAPRGQGTVLSPYSRPPSCTGVRSGRVPKDRKRRDSTHKGREVPSLMVLLFR
jgi:hypothetical protein